MKQYMLSVHGTQEDGGQVPDPEQMQQMFGDVDRLNAEMREQGVWVFACGLREPSTATVVRVERGEVMLTDGPWAETKEQLGGFWIIKAPDLDGALAWAAKATVACQGPIEVRPLQDEPEE